MTSWGTIWNSWSVKLTNVLSIQWPQTTIARATPAILGTKVSVISWIEVIDWSRETANPTARAVSNMGAVSSAVMVIIRTAISMTVVSFNGLPFCPFRDGNS